MSAFFNITSIKSKSQQADNNPAEPGVVEPEEGQLAVDVLETTDEIIVLAPIAGMTTRDVKVTISDDVLTISGSRKFPEELEKNERYFVQECYWGDFSRSIVLPSAVETEEVRAKFRDGILRVVIPKVDKDNTTVIEIEE